MDIVIRKGIILTITIIICLFCATVVAMDRLSELAKDIPISSFDVGTLLSKSFTELNNIDKAQRFLNFGFLFKIEIELDKENTKLKGQNQYKLKIIAVKEEDEKEYNEKFEQKFISDIKGCNEEKCVFVCTAVGIKKDEDGICIQCYDKRKKEFTGSCGEEDFRFRPCPYSNRTAEEEAIKLYMEKYARSDVNGVSDEELLALLKALAWKETSFRHCKDGVVLVGLTGDIGLLQINPYIHKDGDWYILEENIKKGRNILVNNLKFFEGYKEQKRLAIAYYNCGNTVSKAIPEYESKYGSAKEMEWKNFESILAKYCVQVEGGPTTADYVNIIVDNYMKKYINNPNCYDYECV